MKLLGMMAIATLPPSAKTPVWPRLPVTAHLEASDQRSSSPPTQVAEVSWLMELLLLRFSVKV